MINQYTVEASSEKRMTLDELEAAIKRAKGVGVKGDSIVNAETKMEFSMKAKGTPLMRVHFVMPEWEAPPRAD